MRWRAAVMLAMLLLAGCPAGKGNVPATGGRSSAAAPAAPARPLPADAALGLDLLCAAIDRFQPGASAEMEPLIALELAAKLPGLDGDVRFAPLRKSIAAAYGRVRAAQGQPPPVLLAALLAVQPAEAMERIRQLIAAGDTTVFAALRFDGGRASAVLAELSALKLSASQAGMVLDLLRELSAATPLEEAPAAAGFPGAELGPLLKGLAARKEPAVALRACGYLLRLKPGDSQLHERLWQALRDAKPGEMASAAEAARIAGDPALADALIPLAMSIPLRSRPSQARTTSAMLYATYALVFLPGEQAQLMRRKLNEAQDGLARCQVRLGELLAGDPGPWDEEVQAAGIDDRNLWIALEPPEVVSPRLLSSYALAAAQGGTFARGATAAHLNRYSRFQSKDVKRRAAQILQPLLADADPEVRAAGWYTACALGSRPPEKVLSAALRGDQVPQRIRLAAAYIALRTGADNR